MWSQPRRTYKPANQKAEKGLPGKHYDTKSHHICCVSPQLSHWQTADTFLVDSFHALWNLWEIILFPPLALASPFVCCSLGLLMAAPKWRALSQARYRLIKYPYLTLYYADSPWLWGCRIRCRKECSAKPWAFQIRPCFRRILKLTSFIKCSHFWWRFGKISLHHCLIIIIISINHLQNKSHRWAC